MATQHPDNANAPFWEQDGDGFVSAKEEVLEAYTAYEQLAVDEYMWDWEGKHVDEAVVERLLTEHYAYFKKHQLGKDKRLTFRIPNIWQEKGYSLARAFMSILTAADMADDLKSYGRPLFEVILPMTTSAKQLLHIQTTFTKLAKVKHQLFADHQPDFNYIHIIPLIESIEEMFAVSKLLNDYVTQHQRFYKQKPAYIRPFLARSDPALMSGMIAAVIGNKVALSELRQWQEQQHINVYPIVGTGSLPFRGSCAPDRIQEFIEEYRGVKTVTVQSAFRYDYPLTQVKQAIKKLQQKLPNTVALQFSEQDTIKLQQIARKAAKYYYTTIQALAPQILKVCAHIPARRERRLHIGLLGYSRAIGKQKFPRAITFTAAMYSLGVPPELVGTGKLLRSLNKAEGELLHKAYHNLEHDLIQAGHYLNKHTLKLLAKKSPAWKTIQDDVLFIEQYFGIKLEPHTVNQQLHHNATSDLYYLLKRQGNYSSTILKAGRLRNSLG
jgi:phosphoenolpyruvate carboxylase